jgi:hypothetical protein
MYRAMPLAIAIVQRMREESEINHASRGYDSKTTQGR